MRPCSGQDVAADRAQAQERRSRRIVYWVLGSVAGAALALFLVLLLVVDVTEHTLGYEAAKACLQVLSVALVGAAVSFATFTLQRNRERREANTDQRRENWQREVARLRDDRQRKDELLNATLKAVLTDYNSIKRARRLLRARLWAESSGEAMDIKVYDEQMAVINDAQLMFEQHKRTAKVINDGRVDRDRLVRCFRTIEKYLNTLVSEYEAHRRVAAHDPARTLSVRDLKALSRFIDPDDWTPFVTGVSSGFGEALEELRGALLVPLRLPEIEAGDKPHVVGATGIEPATARV
jgi:hypothetical protein